ncbi:MAG TPA: hypothetical protein ENK40_02630 [Gammaproteobacteria bacterium]|nr:hypothetical protein [Gammaproteobacteria bacterium]
MDQNEIEQNEENGKTDAEMNAKGLDFRNKKLTGDHDGDTGESGTKISMMVVLNLGCWIDDR